MKNALLLSLAASTVALSASAASAQDWSGPYLGVAGGYNEVDDSEEEIVQFDTNLDGNFGDTVRTGAGADAFSPGFCDGKASSNNAAAGCSDDDGEGEFAIRAGYDFQSGAIVYGALVEYNLSATSDYVTAFSTTPASYIFKREISGAFAARARIGYDAGTFLPYVTGGAIAANVKNSFASTNMANSFMPDESEETQYGYQAGAGIEAKVTRNLTLGLEYLYTNIEDDDGLVVRTGPGTAPATNPFLLVNPQGTDQRRSESEFATHGVRLTAAVRF
jgi:outer membrane immunogenic protein